MPQDKPTTLEGWKKVALKLKPADGCFAAQKAIVWKSDKPNTINVKLGARETKIDLDAQDQLESNGRRPELWRHLPSDLPEDPTSLPAEEPKSSNAVIYIRQNLATALGIADPLFKWPDCTALPPASIEANLKLMRVWFANVQVRHVVNFGSNTPVPATTRTLKIDGLEIVVPDDGTPWPDPIDTIGLEGFIPGNCSGTLSLLDETQVPRPQSIDLSAPIVSLGLTKNGSARIPGM